MLLDPVIETIEHIGAVGGGGSVSYQQPIDEDDYNPLEKVREV